MNEEQAKSVADSSVGCSVENAVADAAVKPWQVAGKAAHRGPFDVQCVSVYDGDTIKVALSTAMEEAIKPREIYVRLLGCDAPEMTDTRQQEKWTAQAAKRKLQEMVAMGTVTLENVRPDKYSGRILADVSIDGHDCKTELMRLGYAKPWDGNGKKPW